MDKSGLNGEWMARDLAHIWHPCTQMKDHEALPLIPVERAKGVYLYDFEGRAYLDAIGSWWVNLFGHANDYINAKVTRQLEKLEHVLLAGFTHESAIVLAEKLVAITPEGLQKVFFVDNGSSAVEAALKMSYHYHRNLGRKKTLFLSLTNSYHGETLGALSVGDVALYKETYEPLLIANEQVPVPADQSIEAAQEALDRLEAKLRRIHEQTAALIVEPLIQGAGGMHMYHPYYLKGARELTARYDVHLIADEIMTGFGRTGEMFGCDHASISPDFMTLSKGLTGGYLPLSVVMTTDTIYQAFYCDYNEHKAFLHSHSYTGNPLACAASLATLELFERYDTIEANRALSQAVWSRTRKIAALPQVKAVRQQGMVTAIDLIDYPATRRMGLEVYRYGLKRGVLLRPLGNVIYFMPPYVITDEQIETMIEVAYEAIAALPTA